MASRPRRAGQLPRQPSVACWSGKSKGQFLHSLMMPTAPAGVSTPVFPARISTHLALAKTDRTTEALIFQQRSNTEPT
jgi:hypothetical protein